MLIFFGYIYLTTQVVYVDVFNFFLECCLYVEDRELLRDSPQFLDNLIIENLLFGNDSLSEEQNSQIFKSVQLYVKQTKRFSPQCKFCLHYSLFFHG